LGGVFRHWLIYVLLAGISVQAQTINLHGTVTNGGGQPVAGATVTLVGQKLKDTTGVDGTYSIAKGVIAIAPRAARAGQVGLSGGVLEVDLIEPSPMQIEIFDIKSNLLKREAFTRREAGAHRWDIANAFPAAQLLIIRATLGKEVSWFRYTSVGSPNAVAPLKGSGEGNAVRANALLAKAAAAVDTLQVDAAGYQSQSVPVTAFDMKLDVSLTAGGKNAPGPSLGCGKAMGTGLKQGHNKITSSGTQRDFIVDIPTGYKQDHPYRLFFCFHWIGGNDDSIAGGQVEFAPASDGGPANYAFYGLKPQATKANDPAIFIAPQGIGGSWGQPDHPFFDDMLALAKANLCVDITRVFMTGFSFGAMITYSLSTDHQKVVRAAVVMAPANYNIYLPNPIPRDPIPWMSTTGMSDGTCPWDHDANAQQGAKYIALQRGADNGCVVPTAIPTTTVGSKTHVCYDFAGCKPGYPVKTCTFDGPHEASVGDGGTGNVGKDSWIPVEAWKFFTQFYRKGRAVRSLGSLLP